jgi:hypothetical protein
LLAHGWWFSLCTPASTTKTGRHGIAESGIKHQKINQSINYIGCNGKIMLKSFDVHCGMKFNFVPVKVLCSIGLSRFSWLACPWTSKYNKA